MKTITRSILTLSLATAVLALASCQGYSPTPSNQGTRGNVSAYNMSGIIPR